MNIIFQVVGKHGEILILQHLCLISLAGLNKRTRNTKFSKKLWEISRLNSSIVSWFTSYWTSLYLLILSWWRVKTSEMKKNLFVHASFRRSCSDSTLDLPLVTFRNLKSLTNYKESLSSFYKYFIFSSVTFAHEMGYRLENWGN